MGSTLCAFQLAKDEHSIRYL